ncbi:MAG TPA: hypothetical protein DEA90_01080 [Opitutae bacterium]|nr:hypothetical protein [Puniceicoccaceae bacterium]HBR92742.1 hypothetical protein [Opitutae bacterium]
MRGRLQDTVVLYLQETLGVSLKCSPWDAAGAFPHHLKVSYEFEHCDVLGQRFVLFLCRDPELTPASIEKHFEWVESKTGLRGIFVAERLESYNRKRLIERKIPFIVPGNQLYLPDLALDLREHLKKAKKTVNTLSPASQVVVLSFLLGRLSAPDNLTPTGLAKQLPYTKMSMSRVIDELKGLNLVESLEEGRSARNRFVDKGQSLWKQAQPYLRNPVTKRIYLDELFHSLQFKAGEYALDEMTMLVSRRETWAVTSKEWKELQGKDYIHMIPEVSKDLAHAELEIWSYAPKLLTDGPVVDPLSLALSLQHEKDERVEMAVDELLDKMTW